MVFIGLSNVFVYQKQKALEKTHKSHDYQTISWNWCPAWR